MNSWLKNKITWVQIPLILLFTAGFLVTEQSARGFWNNLSPDNRIVTALQTVNGYFTDLKFRIRGAQAPKNKIVVVEVDSASIDAFGRWPWHRDKTAALIQKVFDSGAKVVGLDMMFSEEDRRIPDEAFKLFSEPKDQALLAQFETDPLLEEVIRNHKDNLVLGWSTESVCTPLYSRTEDCPVSNPDAIATFPKDFARFGYSRITEPKTGLNVEKTPVASFVTVFPNIPRFSAPSEHQGYFNTLVDPNGTIRRANLTMIGAGVPQPSLPLEMARVGLGEDLAITFDDNQRVASIEFAKSGYKIPTDPLGVMQVNYRGGERTFTYVSAVELLNESPTIEGQISRKLAGVPKSELLKDAYVFIGISALGVFDGRNFPFGTGIPGVEGHANILDNLLSRDMILPSSGGLSFYGLLILMTLGALLWGYSARELEAIPAILVFFGIIGAVGVVDTQYLFKRNYDLNTGLLYIEIVTLFAVTLAIKYVMEENNKKFIRSAFTKYVSPAVVDSILKDPSKLSLGGDRKDLTILFSDIRSFTTFSENMDAKALSSFLNDYLGIMTKIVFDYNGTLDKYIGDAVMAFWGAPLDQPSHAGNACLAAKAMVVALHENQARFKSQYGIDVNIGVGLNTGVVSVGNMGTSTNFEYTVIGDHVNLASRLEGLTKAYGVTALTSRFTLESVAQTGTELPTHRVLDFVKVKGKKNAVELIEILDHALPPEVLENFTEGRKLYAEQKWDEAICRFESVLKARPDDGPAAVFLERCQEFKKSPPEAGWDGSWEMHSK